MLRSATSRALTCGLVDGLLVLFGPVVLAAIFGADVAYAMRHDILSAWGFLVPLALLAAVWGFFDARAHLSGQPRALRAALSGGGAASGVFLFSQAFGILQTAYAAGSAFPVVGEAAAEEWIQYSLSIALFAVLLGVIGAFCAVGLSAMNAALLRVLPS